MFFRQFWLFGVFTLCSGSVFAQEIIPHEYILKFSDENSSSEMQALSTSLGLEVGSRNELSGSVFATGKLDHQLAKELIASGSIDYLEPNCLYKLKATPNDSELSRQWYLQDQENDIDLDTVSAWDITTGSDEIVVGIIDSGINYNHPDLKDNLWNNAAEVPNNGLDDDLNGVVDDYFGFNALSGAGDPLDNNGHGSHCAGIIGAQGNNNLGVSGINWNVKLMGLKFLDGSGAGSTQDAIEAIEYAVKMKENGVNLRVLSNSWGGTFNSQALEAAIKKTEDAGILFVAAAGNFGQDNDITPIFPASYDYSNILSVAAVDREGNLAPFSNYGLGSVDLAAPGVSIVSTGLDADYNTLSGTSMSAPQVAGVASLLLSAEPNLSAIDLKNRLNRTVQPLDTLVGLLKAPGIVNAGHALTNTLAPEPDLSGLAEYSMTPIVAVDQVDPGVLIDAQDDGYTLLNLPFSFPFYDESFRRLAVSANGRIIPLGEEELLPSNADYSNSLRPGILPWHDDLIPSDVDPKGIWAKIEPSKVTLTWFSKLFAHRTLTDEARRIKVQAILSSDGSVEFHYIDIDTTDSSFANGKSASIGIIPFNPQSGARVSITHNRAEPNLVATGKGIRFVLSGALVGAPKAVKNDFDGDGKSDLVVWRPSNGYWFILYSENNFKFEEHSAHQLGLFGDVPLTGYFDSDSLADIAVWRPADGNWYFRLSSQNYSEISSKQWGLFGDTPLVGDLDGDGRSDLSVFRPSNGAYFTLLSSLGYDPLQEGGYMLSVLGDSNFTPMLADKTGDGRSDYVSVWKEAPVWFSKDTFGTDLPIVSWGISGDNTIECDWNGDGKSDNIVTRVDPASNLLNWFVAATDGAVYTKSFGISGDVVGCQSDYDGDGINEARVWRPIDGNWFFDQTNGAGARMIQFGLPGDIPL